MVFVNAAPYSSRQRAHRRTIDKAHPAAGLTSFAPVRARCTSSLLTYSTAPRPPTFAGTYAKDVLLLSLSLAASLAASASAARTPARRRASVNPHFDAVLLRAAAQTYTSLCTAPPADWELRRRKDRQRPGHLARGAVNKAANNGVGGERRRRCRQASLATSKTPCWILS